MASLPQPCITSPSCPAGCASLPPPQGRSANTAISPTEAMRVGRIVAGELAANPGGCGAGKAVGLHAKSRAVDRVRIFVGAFKAPSISNCARHAARPRRRRPRGAPHRRSEADWGRRFGATLLSGLPIDGLL